MKNRKVFGFAAAALVALSLTACSGGDAPAEKEPATAPVEEQASTQSVTEACIDMAQPLADAGKAIAESAQETLTDPQAAVDAWVSLTSAYEEIAANTGNDEVKAAVTAVHTNTAAVTEQMRKAFLDNDVAAMSEYITATGAMQESLAALQTLCTP